MMTAHEPVQKMLHRILAVQWVYPIHEGSSATLTGTKLMQETLRRTLLWARALNQPDLWPLFDVPGRLLPEAKAHEPYLRYLDKQRFPNVFTWASAHWMLHWAEVEYRSEVQIYQLPAPYEPMLRMYESGAWFRREGDRIMVWDARTGISYALPQNPIDYDRKRPFARVR